MTRREKAACLLWGVVLAVGLVGLYVGLVVMLG
jgi:hypothetical protein